MVTEPGLYLSATSASLEPVTLLEVCITYPSLGGLADHLVLS